MDFGININFTMGGAKTHQEAIRESMEEVDLAEQLGLDTVWLGEMHFNPARSVLSAPIVIASSIATRTKRLRVGMAVQVLPLIHPLRIAEEAATVDQLSEGRFEFGVGRSGNVRAYDIMGIDYGESKDRFQEALDIILMAWSGETFSYEGKYNHITNASISPLPYQQPHPKVRIAASSEDSFGRIGRLGYPIFLGLRTMDVEDLKTNLQEYKQEWKAAGHPGEGGDINVRFPVYIAPSEAEAIEEPKESIEAFSSANGNSLNIRGAGKARTFRRAARRGTSDWSTPPTRTCWKPGWCSALLSR